LYPDNLLNNIDNCKNIPSKERIKSRTELAERIVEIGLMSNEEDGKGGEETA